MFSRHKRPYHELHIITSTYSNPHVRIPLTLLAQSDILMWRSLALLLVARPALLSDHKVCSTTLTLHCQQRGTPAEHNGIHAIIFELLLCWRLGITKFHYNLHGDSMSSLAWAKANRVNSSLARRENIVFTTLSMHLTQTLQSQPTFLVSLSSSLMGFPEMCPQPPNVSKEFNAANNVSMLSILRLCDPDDPIDDITVHTNLSQRSLLAS